MHKKQIIITISVVLLIGIIIFGLFTYETNNEDSGIRASDVMKSKVDKVENKPEDSTAKIEGISLKLDIPEELTEHSILAILHKMTHQKIKADKKWGATPMIEATIDEAYELVKNNKTKNHDVLLVIVTKWKNKDFSSIDEDHNTIWTIQGGNTGRATGKMTEKEEIKFIINNFGEQILDVWSSENDSE